MDAQTEIKQALIHMRKLQTWLSKTKEETVTIDKKMTWPEESKLLKIPSTKMYTYLEILSAIYEYIETNELLNETTTVVLLDKKLQKMLKTEKKSVHIFEVAGMLK